MSRPARVRSYQRVAPFYEEVARALSLGRIGRAKRSQLDYVSPGARVLYAGVGSGEDAVAAVDAGLDVAAVDLSPRMLARLERRLGARASQVRLHCEDFRSHQGGPYDVLALNFFLNVFSEAELDAVLGHALALLAPGGRIAIADFAPPRSRTERVLFELHYRPLLWAAWGLGLAALHPIYDYRARLTARGGHCVAERRFGVYESVVFEVG